MVPAGSSDASRLKVSWSGTFEPDFNRNRKLARLMDLSDIQHSNIRFSVWGSDLVHTASVGRWKAVRRLLLGFPRLAWKMVKAPAPDLYLISYPGWFDVPVVWLISRLKRRPVVYDPYVSLYDTMILDRAIYGENGLVAILARLVDKWSFRLADLVFADTATHGDYYESLWAGTAAKCRVLPVGADDTVFAPCVTRDDVRPPIVLFYGNYIPLHGVPTIVEAAHLLQDEDIEFVLVGRGQDRERVDQRITELGLGNVRLVDPVPLQRLRDMVCEATVCLGIFGASEKAGRVVPNKVFECIAARRPVITREGSGISSAFDTGQVAIVPAADAKALAKEIMRLISEPSEVAQMVDSAWKRYMAQYHESVLAPLLLDALRSVGAASPQSRS